ncbi:MAG: histidine kinase [Chitinophagaceae bacterium]
MNSVSKNENSKSISSVEILIVVFFYIFFSVVFHIVLWYTGGGYKTDGFWGWLNIENYWYQAGMQYIFYFVNSVLIWFFGVYILTKKKIYYQFIAVFLLIPISAYLVRELRYIYLDSIGAGRLRGIGTIWDWYIPSLFLLIQFGCFFAYRYFKDNQRKLKVEGELKQAALKSELSAIKAQLNPHFLYNVFNTINASLSPENEKTRDMIAQLADLFRYQLQATRNDLVTLREEVDFVRKYLELEKARFGDRLQVLINVSDQLLNEKVPPMILQPLVENSIRHGLSSLIEGGTISITICKSGGKLKFEITDTGIGIVDKTKIFERGIGLNNTRLRLLKMYNTQMEFIDNVPKGLKITFAI